MVDRSKQEQLKAARFSERLSRRHRELAARFPDIDPQDLMAILHSLARPIGSGRRFFLRKREGGGFVF